MAWQALVANRLRTTLSLLGMTLGIFSIITVFAVVDSLENSIRDSVERVGNDIVYVQKWPWGGGGGSYPWWKYFQRPEPTYEEMGKLERRLTTADYMAYYMVVTANLNYRSNTADGVGVVGVSHDYMSIWQVPIEGGRYFSPVESNSGRPVAVIGSDIAEGLFPGLSPIGKDIRILGEKVRVIGVLEREGSKLVGESHDELILVPVNYMRRKVNENQIQGTSIMVKALPGVTIDQLKDDLEGSMRGIRRLRPKVENDFALNEITVLNNGMEQLFGVIGIAGMIIGGFALLAGGFGIANIMFVSVSERIGQIGIQKALGARRRFILFQFLTEATFLSVIGGVLGLLIVWGIVVIANSTMEFALMLSMNNVITGLVISAVIGLLFGLIPALNASRLDPVEAIRANS